MSTTVEEMVEREETEQTKQKDFEEWLKEKGWPVRVINKRKIVRAGDECPSASMMRLAFWSWGMLLLLIFMPFSLTLFQRFGAFGEVTAFVVTFPLSYTAALGLLAISFFPVYRLHQRKWECQSLSEFKGAIPLEGEERLFAVRNSLIRENVEKAVILVKPKDPILCVKVDGEYYALWQWEEDCV